MKRITLAYNNPDPSKGGIPRYAHRIINGVEEQRIVSHVDFTEVYGENILEKLYNVLHGRKKYVKNQKDSLGGLNHWLQPEIYYNISEGKDIVTVHDLVLLQGFEDVHNLYEFGRKILISRRFRNALDNADRFISVSEQTKQEMMDYGISENNIDVVNLGVREKFSYQKEHNERDNIIGYLGNLNQRKRVGKLLEDWREKQSAFHPDVGKVPKGDYRLHIGGWGGSEAERLEEEFGDRSDIVFRHRVPEENIVEYYNSMKAFFFPTEYEGFGLPIIEAIACGTPVFVYKDASITKEVREFCIEVESVAEAINIMQEGFDEEELDKNAEKVKKKFDWDKTVEQTLQVYDKV